MNSLFKLDHCTIKKYDRILFSDFSWEIKKGENWAILGNSGAGKTSVLQLLRGDFRITKGNFFYQNITDSELALRRFNEAASFVFFQHAGIRYQEFYYQQRYNSSDVEGTFTVSDFLFEGDDSLMSGLEALNTLFDLRFFLNTEFIKLSNGESRKVFIIKSLLKKPSILCLDNPYVGLDESSRKDLNDFVDHLILQGIHVIITNYSDELPRGITNVLLLKDMQIERSGKITNLNLSKKRFIPESVQMNLSFPEPLNNNFHTAVRLTDVTVRYQDRAVLDRVNLTVRNGEKWVLSGPNGAGKTMLCSLIYADNPQSYVNDIVLFDKPRGGGESIWDIKERIGFLSPELHFYFDTLRTCLETALSGLEEHPFKKEPVREEQIHMAEDLFRYFQLEEIRNKMMNEVSTGIQRVVLFIRVLLKNPSLVLLDEPFIGFDSLMIEKAKRLLDEFCKNRTLLFISHQVSEIPSCIDHYARIRNGHLDILS